jgi:hypothetical protein
VTIDDLDPPLVATIVARTREWEPETRGIFVFGTLGLLREHAPDVGPQPELTRYLADGTLERHLALAEER